jgi:hypothetical protein
VYVSQRHAKDVRSPELHLRAKTAATPSYRALHTSLSARSPVHLPFLQVLELMLSDNGPKSSRREARSNLVALALFLVDWAQLTAILVSSETGWTFS